MLTEKTKFLKENNLMLGYVVFFNKKSKAVFPNNPLAAGYNEESSSRKIKAIYEFNKINGYSKLRFYKKNSWDSVPKEYNI